MVILKLISLLPNIKGKGRIFQFFKKIYLKVGDPIQKANGRLGSFLIDLRSFEWEYYCNGTYDEGEISFILTSINVDEIFLDVGANIGFYSIAIAQKIKDSDGKGRVIAFEPHPRNFERLKQNIQLNSLSDYIDIHMLALSDSEEILNLVLREDFIAGSETGNASIAINKLYDEGFDTVEVKTQILDKFIDFNESELNIGYIKLDIEGHEVNFLRGAQRVIQNQAPQILIEVNKPYYEAAGIDACLEIEKLLPNYFFKNIASSTSSTSTSLSQAQANKIKTSKILSEVAVNKINNIYCWRIK